MLVIDENMFRLAKMQETLLKVSNSNRDENLNNYKKLVKEIDTKAFSDILDEIKHINEHNHSLEEEVKFLETIKNAYDQLLELQSSFKKVCEMYGNRELQLSDLSKLNIDYIDNRINTINGYLVNIRNIDMNKKKIQELNEQLVVEEKNKIYLDNKLLEMERTLRNNFINAEGRFILNGELQFASVVSEYKSLDFDFNELLSDNSLLTVKLSELENKKMEISESVRVAEICYNNMLNTESKQILNELNSELLMVDYKLTMLKIIALISRNCIDYNDFVNKRKQLVDLIKYRVSCMKQLGKVISIDPFGRTKVEEQLEVVLSLPDNSKIINKIRKDLGELNLRTEEMLSQNNNYLISLNNTKELIEKRVGISDINISSLELPFDELQIEEKVSENQVICVKNIPNTLNMNIASQKTSSVIKRVNRMMDRNSHEEKVAAEVITPELVIVSKAIDEMETKKTSVGDGFKEDIDKGNIFDNETVGILSDMSFELDDELEEDYCESKLQEGSIEDKSTVNDDLTGLFETVIPFEEPSLFVDKTDESVVNDLVLPNIDVTSADLNSVVPENIIQFQPTVSDSAVMPEAFWVTQEDTEPNLEEETTLSFDDQIKALLSTEDKSDGMVRKKVA